MVEDIHDRNKGSATVYWPTNRRLVENGWVAICISDTPVLTLVTSIRFLASLTYSTGQKGENMCLHHLTVNGISKFLLLTNHSTTYCDADIRQVFPSSSLHISPVDCFKRFIKCSYVAVIHQFTMIHDNDFAAKFHASRKIVVGHDNGFAFLKEVSKDLLE